MYTEAQDNDRDGKRGLDGIVEKHVAHKYPDVWRIRTEACEVSNGLSYKRRSQCQIHDSERWVYAWTELSESDVPGSGKGERGKKGREGW